jgi:hypothetical protein
VASADMSLIDVVTRFILPPILGGAGGLITVYANWGIEKRRARLAHQKELIAKWRDELLPLLRPGYAFGSDIQSQFFAVPAFASLQPHLSPQLLSRMRSNTIVVGGDFPRRDLIVEIGRLEKRWGLV